MKKAVEINREKTKKSKPSVAKLQPLDFLSAILETEYQTSELLCIENDPPAYLYQIWNHVIESDIPNIHGLPPTTLRGVRGSNPVGQLVGMSKKGNRCALITTVPIQQSLKRGNPFIIHSFAKTRRETASGNYFQLTARTPQKAIDFCLIAHRMSELSLCPGILHVPQDLDLIDYEMTQLVQNQTIEAFLGRSSDQLPSPSEPQKEIFGEIRKRVPPGEESYLLQHNELEDILFKFAQQSIEEFKTITDRDHGLIETINCEDAELIVVATGNQFDWLAENLEKISEASKKQVGLIHPNLIKPFPAHLVIPFLVGKTGLAMDSNNDSSILQEIQLGFDKAVANGQKDKDVEGQLPYPLYPVFNRLEDRPKLVACETDGDSFTLTEIAELIARVTDPTSTQIHFKLHGVRHKKSLSLEAGDESQKALNLVYRDTNSYFACRGLVEKMHQFLNLHFKMASNPETKLCFTALSRKSTRPQQPLALADCMISPDLNLSSLEQELSFLKSDGVFLCLGNHEDPQQVWQSMTQTCRSVFKKKRIKLFLVNRIEQDQSNFELTLTSQNGVILGALLKLSFLKKLNLLDETKITNTQEIISLNGEKDFVKAVQQGFDNVHEIQYLELEAKPVLEFDQPDPDVIHEEKVEPGLLEEDKVFREFQQFFQTGDKKKFGGLSLEDLGLLPVQLHSYRNFSRFRCDYPFCLVEDESEDVAVPLIHVFDHILSQIHADGDEKEKIQRDVLKLESRIESLVEEGIEGRLTKLWDLAAEGLNEEIRKEEAKNSLNKSLAIARQELERDGKILPYNRRSIEKLFQRIAGFQWTQRSKRFLREVDELIVKLKDILKSDLIHSPESRDPENLEASVGSTYEEDFDFASFSNILEEAPHGEPLAQNRRKRIETTLKILQSKDNLFKKEVSKEQKLGISLGLFYALMRDYVKFFRAVRIGQLEVDNKYIETRHDSYFAGFKLQQLTIDEANCIPPFIIDLDYDIADFSTHMALIDVLSSKLPLKILMISNQLFDQPGFQVNLSSVNKLASMLLSLKETFVMQSTSSNFNHLVPGFKNGLSFNGPALFSVFNGPGKNFKLLHPYFASAMALESRAFPAFIFDPSKGNDWATQFSLDENPQVESVWSNNEITYLNADDEEQSLQVPFTFVDYLSTDNRFSEHFLPVSRSNWHKNMIPLVEFFELSDQKRFHKVPFILMAGENGLLYRVIVTLQMVRAAEKIAGFWHGLRELAGIDSSHLQSLVDAERSKLEEKNQEELAKVEAKYQEELDKTVGELSKEIVSNIASGLLSDSITAPSTTPAPPTAPAPVEEKPADLPTSIETEEPAKEEVEEEEEVIILDEAYIETPRCTACNECTNINPRMFAYNNNKQAYIQDIAAGTFRELVDAAEKCPVHIIHPGKPNNPDEPHLEELQKRAEPFL